MSGADVGDALRSNFGAVVRTVLSGLILAGICGVVALVWHNGKESQQADTDRAVQIAKLQTQITEVQRGLSGVTEMGQRVMRLETNQAELMRRQAADEAWREHFNDNGPRRGTR